MDGYNVKNYTEQGGEITHFGGNVIFEEGSQVEGLPSPAVPTASKTVKGIVKVGDGINVTEDGTISGDGYQKPSSGIPKSDMADDVKESLGKADTALQTHQSLASYSLTSETGYRLDLIIDSSTYVITPKLYDKNGNLISTGSSVDLPLESVVISGSYNKTTKKVVLTLKNGSKIEFSIADLIDGLVSQADFDVHKNNASEHVSGVERSTWNAKYEKPSAGIPKTDMAEDVKASLGKADTALQEHQSLALYSLITETGYRIQLFYNETLHAVIPRLYDKNNTLITEGTAMTLPESGVPVTRKVSDNTTLENDISSQNLTNDLKYIAKETLKAMVESVFFAEPPINFSKMRSGSADKYCIGYKDSLGNEVNFPYTPIGRVIKKETYSPSDFGFTPILESNIESMKRTVKYVEYPPSVTEMPFDFDASFNTHNIKSVVFPSNFVSIRSYAFEESGLCDMSKIPASVTSIGEDRPFEGVPLKAFEVDENNANYCSVDGVLFTKNMLKMLFWPCGRTADTYEVPQGTTHIGRYAFSKCSAIRKIILPSSMTSLGGYIFNSDHITELVCKASVPPNAKADGYNGAFEGATIDKIVVPVGTLSSYQRATEWSRFASKMVEEEV